MIMNRLKIRSENLVKEMIIVKKISDLNTDETEENEKHVDYLLD